MNIFKALRKHFMHNKLYERRLSLIIVLSESFPVERFLLVMESPCWSLCELKVYMLFDV